MNDSPLRRLTRQPIVFLVFGLLCTIAAYLPGLSGGWLFDDYPNIVDNRGVQPQDANLSSLVRAALSSPSSEFKRPLASLTFALNYLASGLNAPAMKVTNLVIHLGNGVLAYLLLCAVIRTATRREDRTSDRYAAFLAVAWMVLPINVTSVLYVVQRMESLANLFVLGGLYAYVAGRRRMLVGRRGLTLCVGGVIVGTAVGVLAKETAVMLPLYALSAEAILFRWRAGEDAQRRISRTLIGFFILVLAVPFVVGSAWLIPRLLDPQTWSTRTFTMTTRLLSEARIVTAYVDWTLFPTPGALSFYHDDFVQSAGLFQPWTTLASILALGAAVAAMIALRSRMPLTSLGIAWYLGCHLLTGTILPLELVYEHRNYFASLAVLLVATDLLRRVTGRLPAGRPLIVCVATIFLSWQAGLTWATARSWGDPLMLAKDLAERGPRSPRAQYELGRAYIIYSRYDPASPYPALATRALETAASLEGASILPEQALIFMNSHMHRPIDPGWWKGMIEKLRANSVTVQDESALDALATCLRNGGCDFPLEDLRDAYVAALAHPKPSGRLLSMYANFAWSSLGDRPLARAMQQKAIAASPGEAAYRINFVRMSATDGDVVAAREQLTELRRMNLGGALDSDIASLDALLRDAERKVADQQAGH